MAWAEAGSGFEYQMMSSGTTGTSTRINSANFTTHVPGEIIIVTTAHDNTTATTPSITLNKPVGESADWVLLAYINSPQAAAGGGARGEMWGIQTTVDWNNFAIQATYPSVVKRATFFCRYTGGSLVPRNGTLPKQGLNSPGGVTLTDTEQLLAGDLAIGFNAEETNAVANVDSSNSGGAAWSTLATATSGGSAASNVASRIQYKFVATDALVDLGLYSDDGGVVLIGLRPAAEETGTPKEGSDTASISVSETSSIDSSEIQMARPDGTGTVVGIWTGSHLDVDEAIPDDNDFIASSTNPAVEDFYSITLSSLQTPQAGPHTIRFRYAKDADAGRDIQLQVQLRQGDGQVITDRNLGILTSSAWQQDEYTLTSEEVALITDYEDLRFRFVPTASGGGAGRAAKISWLEFEVPEAAVVENLTKSASDTSSISVSESSSIEVFAEKSASDTSSLSVSESSSMQVLVEKSASDTLTIAQYDASYTVVDSLTNLIDPLDFNTGLWNYGNNTALEDGKFLLYFDANGLAEDQIDAKDFYDFNDAEMVVHIKEWFATGAQHYDKSFSINLSSAVGNTAVSLQMWPNNPIAILNINGVEQTFNPTVTMAGETYLRFRLNSGIFYLDESVDNAETWTNLVTTEYVGSTTVKPVFHGISENYEEPIMQISLGGINVIDTPSGFFTKFAMDESALSVNEVSGKTAEMPGAESISLGVSESVSIANTQTASDGSIITLSETTSVSVTQIANETSALAVTEEASKEQVYPPLSLWAINGPATTVTDTTDYTMGTEFYVTEDAEITAIKFWRPGNATATNFNVVLYQVNSATSGVAVASVTGQSTSAQNQWVKISLAQPYMLTANQRYRACIYSATNNFYPSTANYWSTGDGSAGITNGILVAPNSTNATGQDQGSYIDVSAAPYEYPTLSFNSSNYWIDVEITQPNVGPPEEPISGSDSDSLSVSETTELTKQIAASDAASISTAEENSRFITKTASDTTALSASDISNTGSTLPGTDSTSLGLSETVLILIVQSSSDTAGLTVEEVNTIGVSALASDSTTLSVAEANSSFRTINSSDSVSLSVNDISSVGSTLPGVENIALAISDASSTLSTGTVSDSVTLAVAEQTTTLVTVLTSDSAGLGTIETTTSARTIVASDTAALAVTEVSSTGSDMLVPGADSATLGIAESIEAAISQPASDTASIVSEETVQIFNEPVAVETASLAVEEATSFIKDITATDESILGVSEVSGTGQDVFTPGAESISVGIVEEISLWTESDHSDEVAIAVDESYVISVEVYASDQTAVGTEEYTAGYTEFTTEDSSAITVTDSAGLSGGDNLPANEVTGISVVEQTYLSITDIDTDGAALGVIEDASIYSTRTRTDASALAVSESVQTYSTLSSSDTSSISASEVSNVSSTLPGQENVSLGLSEQSSIVVSVSRTDILPIVVTETRTTHIEFSSFDNVGFAVADLSATNEEKTLKTSSDLIGLVLSDASAVEGYSSIVRTDSIAISVTEANSSFRTRAAGDTASIAITETIGRNSTLPGIESISLGIVETATIFVTEQSADDAVIDVDESSGVLSDLTASASDSAAVQIEESSDIEVTLADEFFKDASESIGLGVTEITSTLAEDMKTYTFVFLNGQWVSGTAMVYRNGKWRECDIKLFINGRWV